MIGAPRLRRTTRITDSASHLFPYLPAHGLKLPGDDAPPVEPPPALKERIMAVVHAEVRARQAGAEDVVLHASASSVAAPGAGAVVTIAGGRASLRVWGLRPSAARVHRVWLLEGPAPRVPRPGPALDLDAGGGAEADLGALGTAREIVVAPESGTGAPQLRPVLRVRVPPGVAAGPGR